MDSFAGVLQVLNAAGIPLFATGVVLLILAYQRSGEAYRDGSKHLREENDRLRSSLTERDGEYFRQVDRISSMLAKSDKAIEELQARKIALLSSKSDITTDDDRILAEVKKINGAIQVIQDLPTGLHSSLHYMGKEFDSTATKIGQLAEEIGDVQARLAIVAIITSPEIHRKLVIEVSSRPRGLVTDSERIKEIADANTPAALGSGESNGS